MLPLDKFTIKYSTVEKQGTAATLCYTTRFICLGVQLFTLLKLHIEQLLAQQICEDACIP